MSEVKNEVEVVEATQISIEEAKEALRKDKEAREAKGKAEIEEVLKKYNLVIDILYSLSEDKRGVAPQLNIVAV